MMHALLHANSQSMEALGIIGPSQNIHTVPHEILRKVDNTDKVGNAIENDISWETLYSRQIKVEEEIFKLTLLTLNCLISWHHKELILCEKSCEV